MRPSVAAAGMFVVDDKLDRETNLLLPPTCYFRSMSREAAARPFRLTQARIGDALHDGDGTGWRLSTPSRP